LRGKSCKRALYEDEGRRLDFAPRKRKKEQGHVFVDWQGGNGEIGKGGDRTACIQRVDKGRSVHGGGSISAKET